MVAVQHLFIVATSLCCVDMTHEHWCARVDKRNEIITQVIAVRETILLFVVVVVVVVSSAVARFAEITMQLASPMQKT